MRSRIVFRPSHPSHGMQERPVNSVISIHTSYCVKINFLLLCWEFTYVFKLFSCHITVSERYRWKMFQTRDCSLSLYAMVKIHVSGSRSPIPGSPSTSLPQHCRFYLPPNLLSPQTKKQQQQQQEKKKEKINLLSRLTNRFGKSRLPQRIFIFFFLRLKMSWVRWIHQIVVTNLYSISLEPHYRKASEN